MTRGHGSTSLSALCPCRPPSSGWGWPSPPWLGQLWDTCPQGEVKAHASHCNCLYLQGKYILTPSPVTYGEEQLLHFLGQLLGIAIRADVPLPLDLLPSFWKTLVGEPLDPDRDLQEADILTYNYVKKFESVSGKCIYSEG